MTVMVRLEIEALDPGIIVTASRTVEAPSFQAAGDMVRRELRDFCGLCDARTPRLVGAKGWWRGRALGGSRGE